MKVNLNVSFN